MMSRAALLTFLIAFALGLGAGLYIGWVASPVQYTDTDLASLRQPVRDDGILMIATVYANDQNLEAARARLAELGFADPGPAVASAGRRFVKAQAPEANLRRLAHLAAALNAAPPELQPYLP